MKTNQTQTEIKPRPIAEIRRSGVKVHVTHARRLKGKSQNDLLTLREIREINEQLERVNTLNGPDNQLQLIDISPTGGATKVKLEFADGTIREARLKVWHKDGYNKLEGINRCLAKIIETTPEPLLPLIANL